MRAFATQQSHRALLAKTSFCKHKTFLFMWMYPEVFDVLVIGGGHAGSEAAHAAARMGAKTLLLTMNLDTIGKMSCNPAIGGTAKGHIVREIDALGGLMGKIADRTAIQFRMLNASKGPAVWAPRAQTDRLAYQMEMKAELEKVPNLTIHQGTIDAVEEKEQAVTGVVTREKIFYRSRTVILSAGTFMRGILHFGNASYSGGRAGDKAARGLSRCLEKLGFILKPLKTGTPPRIHLDSVMTSALEKQPSEEGVAFSFDPQPTSLPKTPCFITYTNEKTKALIRDHLHLSPLYSGKIQSVGPRYCPSIEDKIVRFPDKERHQIFLEPEGLHTKEVYVNGLSSSLPPEVQQKMLRSIPGLEKASIMRFAYAIEYDYVVSGAIKSSLETKKIQGLFFAGQINGTTGYEEAAAQGLLAGINAALQVAKKPPFTLNRSEAYIGVMLDDLISKELSEPYRMFTSRAEYRLLLRQDTADLRLRAYGYALGLLDEKTYARFQEKKRKITSTCAHLRANYVLFEKQSVQLAKLLSRPDFSYQDILSAFPQKVPDCGPLVNQTIEMEIKYAGYIKREQKEAQKLIALEKQPIPSNFDYGSVKGLRTEALEKLRTFQPETIGQAGRLSGVSPADLSILIVALQKRKL